jgi:hypothetical protein
VTLVIDLRDSAPDKPGAHGETHSETGVLVAAYDVEVPQTVADGVMP